MLKITVNVQNPDFIRYLWFYDFGFEDICFDDVRFDFFGDVRFEDIGFEATLVSTDIGYFFPDGDVRHGRHSSRGDIGHETCFLGFLGPWAF